MIQNSISSEKIHQDADLSLGCLFSELPTEIKNKMAEYLDLKDLCAFIRVNKRIKRDIDHFGCFKRFLELEFQHPQPEKLTKEMFTFEVRRRNGIKLDHSNEFYETQLSRWFLENENDEDVLLNKEELRFFTISELNELKSFHCTSDISKLLIDGHLTKGELRWLASTRISWQACNCLAKLIRRGQLTVGDLQEFTEEECERFSSSEIVELILSNHITVREVLELNEQGFDRLDYPGIRKFIQEGHISLDNILDFQDSDYNRLTSFDMWDLVQGGHITVEGTLCLTDNELYRLRKFATLIQGGHVTVVEVLDLSYDDVQKFNNPELIAAIEAGRLSMEDICSRKKQKK